MNSFFRSKFDLPIQNCVCVAFCVLVMLAAGTQSAHAQEKTVADTLTAGSASVNLSQAIQIALANNSEIKRALLSLKNADEQVRVTKSEIYPEISGTASYTRNLEIPVNFVPAKFFDPQAPSDELVPLQFGTDNNWSAGISVTQTIFDGEVFVGVSSAEIFKAVQAENLRATSQQIVTDVRMAYYNVLLAEERLRLQQESVERLRRNLKENRIRHEAGLIDEYTVLQVEVELSNQEPQLTEAKYAVQQAYRQLKMVMGIPLDLPIELNGNLGKYNILRESAVAEVNKNLKKVTEMTPYVVSAENKLIKVAKDLRGDIRVLEKRNDFKSREIKAIKSRFLPTLSASYNLNYNAAQPGSPNFFGTEETRARSQTIGLTLSVPIFDGFRRSANVQIAQIEKKDLELQKHMAVRAAKNEIESARERLNQAIETADARRKALKQARKGYQRARTRLENGLGSQTAVSDAEFQLRQAELNFAQMVYDYLSAKAQYDKAIGMVPFIDKSKPELE